MSNSYWKRASAYAAVVAVAAVGYAFAQNTINSRTARLAITVYFECLERFNAYDWSKFPGEPPPASETCTALSQRQRVN